MTNKEKLDKAANLLLLLVPVAIVIAILGFAASERDPVLLIAIVVLSYCYIPVGSLLGIVLKAISERMK